MAITLEALGIDRLSVEERIDLVQKIWDSITHESMVVPLSEEQRNELERRADEDDADPDDVIPWEQVMAESIARCSR